MPRLHEFVSRDAHYVLTSINGAVVSYQLTPAGERRLTEAGVVVGQRFERALLLDLYRSRDAYARGHEFPEAVRANQLELDMASDPNPENAFPACDECASVIDLHLELSGRASVLTASLRCPACRATPKVVADTSIPLALLTRSLVNRLFEDYGVSERSPNVLRYVTLLDTEFAQRWERLRKQRGTIQTQFFDGDVPGGLGLA